MEQTHIKPFKYAIQNKADMIMAAHLHCTCFEQKEIPTSLSENALSFLRNNLEFNGVIISDDMVMKGVARFGQLDACIMGIKAGLNMFIYRNSDTSTINMIEELYKIAKNDNELKNKIEDSYNRICKLKMDYKII